MTRHHSQSQSLAATPTLEAEARCATSAAVPAHDAIAQRAYEVYLKSGRTQGQWKQNWQQAEAFLHGQAATHSAERSPGGAPSHVPVAH